MNKFGQIKSNIESLMTKSYGKNSFKTNMKSFKNHVIENEKLAEAYFLYDELSKKKGLSKEIVDDYVNECIETIKDILSVDVTLIPSKGLSASVKRRCPNTEKLERLTDFKIKTGLIKGLQESVKWYRNYYEKKCFWNIFPFTCDFCNHSPDQPKIFKCLQHAKLDQVVEFVRCYEHWSGLGCYHGWN